MYYTTRIPILFVYNEVYIRSCKIWVPCLTGFGVTFGLID